MPYAKRITYLCKVPQSLVESMWDVKLTGLYRIDSSHRSLYAICDSSGYIDWDKTQLYLNDELSSLTLPYKIIDYVGI